MEQYVIAAAVVTCAAAVGIVANGGVSSRIPEAPRSLVAQPEGGRTSSARTAPSAAHALRRDAERSAAGFLREIAAAQSDFQASAAVDVDGDGTGEFGYLGELTATSPLRASGGAASGVLPEALLDPHRGVPTASGNARHAGYHFAIYVPGEDARGVGEALGGGSPTFAPLPVADLAETHWCAYAWPIAAGHTGDRAFFVDQDGVLLATDPLQRRYSGDNGAPRAEAAYDARFRGDMTGLLPKDGSVSHDGLVWTRYED